MSIIFLGSGGFGIPALEELADSDHRPALVVTRPDRQGGRGLRPIPTPIRRRARELAIGVEAPASANDLPFIESLRTLRPDLIIAVDYGEILREGLLALPRIGVFNLHASLLPRHRGAAPIPAAILAGDSETGVTLFRITKGLDCGPVVERRATQILPLETAGELEERLARLGADLLISNLERLLGGAFGEEPQKEELATLAPKLPRGAGALDWTHPPQDLVNFIRAMSPRPGAYAFLERAASEPSRGPERIRILRARAAAMGELSAGLPAPGVVSAVEKHSFRVAAIGGEIEPLQLQPAGKSAMGASEFLRGSRIVPGDRFGPGPAGAGGS